MNANWHKSTAPLAIGSTSFADVMAGYTLKILIAFLVATKIKAKSAGKQAGKTVMSF